jgi:hypothetical protein
VAEQGYSGNTPATNSAGQPLCTHGVAPSLLGGKLACKACADLVRSDLVEALECLLLEADWCQSHGWPPGGKTRQVLRNCGHMLPLKDQREKAAALGYVHIAGGK